MKIFYVAALCLMAAEVSSDPLGENRQLEVQQAPNLQLLKEQLMTQAVAANTPVQKVDAGDSEQHKLMVITDTRFVPLDQFLGLPNLNDLPPASAGISDVD